MATAAAEATADAPKPKGNLKKILLISLSALVLLGGAGAGVLIFLQKKQAAAEQAAEAAEEAEPKSRRDPKVLPVFVALEPFTVNLADKNADRFAQVTVSLEVTDGKTGDQIKAFMPAVRSNMLLTITSRSADDLIDAKGKIRLAHELHLAALRSIGASTKGVVPPPEVVAAAATAASGTEAAPARKSAPRADADPPPIVAVHFSNFIIQ